MLFFFSSEQVFHNGRHSAKKKAGHKVSQDHTKRNSEHKPSTSVQQALIRAEHRHGIRHLMWKTGSTVGGSKSLCGGGPAVGTTETSGPRETVPKLGEEELSKHQDTFRMISGRDPKPDSVIDFRLATVEGSTAGLGQPLRTGRPLVGGLSFHDIAGIIGTWAVKRRSNLEHVARGRCIAWYCLQHARMCGSSVDPQQEQKNLQ